jgi:hypothetical protein
MMRLLQEVVPKFMGGNSRERPAKLGSAGLFTQHLQHRLRIDPEFRNHAFTTAVCKPQGARVTRRWVRRDDNRHRRPATTVA